MTDGERAGLARDGASDLCDASGVCGGAVGPRGTRGGGGTIALHTPGHTPGHLCLYVKRPKVLIAGDALNVEEGKLIGPRAQFTADLAVALRSVEKLARYDIESVICYHGGIYNNADVNQRIAEIARGA